MLCIPGSCGLILPLSCPVQAWGIPVGLQELCSCLGGPLSADPPPRYKAPQAGEALNCSSRVGVDEQQTWELTGDALCKQLGGSQQDFGFLALFPPP